MRQIKRALASLPLSHFYQHLFWAAFTLAYFGFLHVGELVPDSGSQASVSLSGFSAEPALPAFCRLAFDFAGFNENLFAFCRLESFAGFTFLPAGGHFASLKLTQRDETRGKTNPPKPGSIRIRRGSVRIFEDPWIRGSKKKMPAQLVCMMSRARGLDSCVRVDLARSTAAICMQHRACKCYVTTPQPA